jgi:hypothetical protein
VLRKSRPRASAMNIGAGRGSVIRNLLRGFNVVGGIFDQDIITR